METPWQTMERADKEWMAAIARRQDWTRELQKRAVAPADIKRAQSLRGAIEKAWKKVRNADIALTKFGTPPDDTE